jgi:transcriptional regulator with XRE-family HTH domain
MDPREIGRRIKTARDAKLWTQADLSRHANVSLSTVSRWENGKLPPVPELVRVAGVLEVEPGWLVEVPSLSGESNGASQRLDRLEAEVEDSRRILVAVAEALGVDVEPLLARRGERAL